MIAMKKQRDILSMNADELKEFMKSLTLTEKKEVYQILSSQITSDDYERAHAVLNDALYDAEGYIIGEKHPDY